MWRDNHSRTVDVTIGTPGQDPASPAPADDGGIKPVGMSLEPLTPDARSQLNLPPSASGVLVGQVTPGSRADESGVQAGDVIERVAATPVSSPERGRRRHPCGRTAEEAGGLAPGDARRRNLLSRAATSSLRSGSRA